MKKINLFFVIISFSIVCYAQSNTDDFLKNLMMTRPQYFENVVNNSEKYRLQIIYTEIDRDSNGTPSFTDYTYRLNENEYYYTASMIKLPLILMTLEKLNQIEGIDKFSKVTFDACGCEKGLYADTSSKNNLVTFNHIIKKALILSNNDAFNRMYDFLGQKYCNKRLWQLGFTKVRVLKRFRRCSAQQDRLTCPVNFYDDNGNLIYNQKAVRNDTIINGWHKDAKIGKGTYNTKTQKTNYTPKDFTNFNYIRLQDLHKFVEMVFFPEIFPDSIKFDLTENDYNTVRKYMGMFPRESRYPFYKPYKKYYDSYVKYYFLGNSTKKVPENIRIFDKVGMSFGFMSDVAYIVDYENNIEFFLSAVIYTNENGIFYDDIYEYRKIALPFFEQLGFLILDYEKEREKKYLPNLIKFDYSNGN